MDKAPIPPTHASVVQVFLVAATPTEQALLLSWAQELQAIRQSVLPKNEKAVAAIRLTYERKTMIPLLKILAQRLKRIAWDETSWKSRLSMGGVLVTLTALGNAGAGIAAFGGAIGVPLWLVVGSGGLVLGTIIDKLAPAVKNAATSETA